MSDDAATVKPASYETPGVHDMLEPSARALSEYIVRIAVLPFTLLMIKPRDIARLVASGAYRPLPPPFLLTFVTGVAVSGVVSNLGLLFTYGDPMDGATGASGAAQAFVTAVLTSFREADGIKALLFAIPYVAAIWIFSGIVSCFMGRGFRNVEPILAFLSFTMAAIVEFGILIMVMVHVLAYDSETAFAYAGLGTILLFFFILVMLVKLFRYLMHVRAPTRWNWIGLLLGFSVASVILLLAALVAFVPAGMIIDNKIAAEIAATPGL
ncbi:hypothetical protein [Hyphomonas johnsonii]|uniref:Yip1 domain-containing protein n=1 Tax=Hyphomonas johnsonii MHS-2 TaxID=1280950 RepID=A0A059FU07_9PROT|nr:hypothetical protein [Hyphomonas johnsonii]KCZ93986.1 hypothetical protein HJO_01385 [Hyphomonas johnsonii MHS-2]